MNWIDTHSHIYQDDFNADLTNVLERAGESGVKKILLPNIDMESVDGMHRLCDTYPSICYPMMGLHPTSVNTSVREDLKSIRKYFDTREYIAVGEIGIDLYWDKTYLKEQVHAFEEQLKWSIDLQLPVVIHNRDAFPYVMESILRIGQDKLKGIFHSFGGSREQLEEILLLDNFLIGINGVVTFKKAAFREYLNLAPIEKIVVETDAPYLSPEPYRGKRNEPAYLLYAGRKLAEVYGVGLEEIAQATTSNALRLFNLPNDFQ